jgi:hypothetical protein
MSVISNTLNTYDVKGIREDLSDAIYQISPEDTPFMSNAGRGKAKQTLFEWQIDSLANPDAANAQLEGDDVAAFDVSNPTTRLGNLQQISRKTAIVSDTNEEVDKAGRDSEMAYQLSKKSAEIKRDMETILIGTNQGAVNGATATARKTGSLLAFVKSNTDKGAGGVDPVYTTLPTGVRTDGTQRAFTETILKSVMQKQWTAGGHVDTLMVGGLQKQVVSTFVGIAQARVDQPRKSMASIVGAADFYVSDFGNLGIVPNRFQRNRDAWFLDFGLIDIAFLRNFRTRALAKTGGRREASACGRVRPEGEERAGPRPRCGPDVIVRLAVRKTRVLF